MEQLPPIIDKSWHQYLQPLFNDQRMALLKYMILPKYKFYPDGKDIFNVFRMPLDKIKVVILGQDPYNKGEAIGYAFAVKEGMQIPKSLQIIKKEIVSSAVERDTKTNIDSGEWQTLKHWRNQGVFLLNTALTVEPNNPNSHATHWKWFTTEVIKIISMQNRVVWLLWGSNAKGFKGFIHKYYGFKLNPKSKEDWCNFMGDEYNYTIEAVHPAAETHADSSVKFTGCNHFKICNEILKLKKQSIINW